MLPVANGQSGFTFVEIIIAIALIGILAAGFIAALTASSNNTQQSDEKATAESLARTEMEYVRERNYLAASWAYEVGCDYWETANSTLEDLGYQHNLSDIYGGYVVRVSASPLHATDDGIQALMVSVYHGESVPENLIFSLENYKVL